MAGSSKPASAIWKYRNNTTINDPSRGNVRFNDLDLTLASSIALAHTSDNGVDIATRLSELLPGDVLEMTSIIDPTKSAQYQLTAAPVVGGPGWSSIGITHTASAGPVFVNAEAVALAINANVITVPELVTLATAKAHLHITTPEGDPGDADIQLKLDQAEAIILNYLKGAHGAAIDWVSPATTPPPVTAGILLMLARLYEQRGDDEEKDEKLWAAIDRLLTRYRDPALA
jgi:hypothetical protein